MLKLWVDQNSKVYANRATSAQYEQLTDPQWVARRLGSYQRTFTQPKKSDRRCDANMIYVILSMLFSGYYVRVVSAVPRRDETCQITTPNGNWYTTILASVLLVFLRRPYLRRRGVGFF